MSGLVLYLAAAASVVSWSLPSVHAPTYISENALNLGYTRKRFSSGDQQEAQALADRLRSLPTVDDRRAAARTELSAIRGISLEPIPSGADIDYAILRSARGDGTEAIALTATWTLPDGRENAAGVALVIQLAKCLSQQNFMAKDILFLIFADPVEGPRAWADGYHSGDVDVRAMFPWSGAIQGAVNVELPSGNVFGGIDLVIEGANGQLPNLDLVNSVVRLSSSESIPVRLPTTPLPFISTLRSFFPTLRTQLDNFETTASMMSRQMMSSNRNAHIHFLRHKIPALTLCGFPASPGGPNVRLGQLGRATEATCHALNNLLERFHQSFFLYLLPSTSAYVSIATYMPALGMLVAASAILILPTWSEMKWVSMDVARRVAAVVAVAAMSGVVGVASSPDVSFTITVISSTLCALLSLLNSLSLPIPSAYPPLLQTTLFTTAGLSLAVIGASNFSLGVTCAFVIIPILLFFSLLSVDSKGTTPEKKALLRAVRAMFVATWAYVMVTTWEGMSTWVGGDVVWAYWACHVVLILMVACVVA